MPEKLLDNILRNSLLAYGNRLFTIGASFLYVLIVANHLGPEKYGLLSFLLDFFAGGIMIFGFSALSETLVIFMPKGKSAKFASGLLRHGMIFAGFISLAILLFAGNIAFWLGQGTPELVRIVALVTFLTVPSTLIASFLNGTKNFGKILKLGIAETSLNLVLSAVALFAFNGGIAEILYAKTISLLAATLLGWRYYGATKLEPTKPPWGEAAKFFANSAALGFLRRLSSQATLFFMTALVNPALFGLYYLLLKISTYPVDLPVASLNDVLLPVTSEHANDREKLNKIISKSIKLYIVASVLFSTALLLAGEFMLKVFFPKYAAAATLIPLFAAYYLMTFDIPLGTFYRVINGNDVLVKSNILVVAATFFPGYWLIAVHGLHGVVMVLIATRLVQLLYLYADMRLNNYGVEFVPRISDLRYFFEAARTAVYSRFKGQ